MSRKKSSSPSGLSRRAFIKGAGLTAAGTAVLESGILNGNAAAEAADSLGPDAVPLTLRVNGAARQLKVEPRTTLADALRTELGLTGTKVVCDRGACSACSVWLDGTPVNSCTTFALDAVGREVTTVEGLMKAGELHPVQTAFIEHDAMQCGYCTSGMVMSCAGLLAQNPDPTLADVQHATRGNLCRCGTYPKVFEATLAAAQSMRAKKGA